MTDTEYLLQAARHEICELRRRCEILQAKVDMIDLFATVLRTNVARVLAVTSPDIVVEIEEKLTELAAGKAPIPDQLSPTDETKE
jgi:hypothetical protein